TTAISDATILEWQQQHQDRLNPAPLDDTTAISDATILEWQREKLIDHEGKLLGTAPRPVWHKISFKLTKAELSLQETLRKLVSLMTASNLSQDSMTRTLLRSFQSSPDALGSALRRLSDRLTGNIALKESPSYMDYEAPENQLDSSIDPSFANETVIG